MIRTEFSPTLYRSRPYGLGLFALLSRASLCVPLLLAGALLLPRYAEGARDPRREAARYFGMGNAAYDSGQYAQAERMFRVCIALQPDLAGPYRRLGQSLKRQDRCEEALDHYLTYLRLKPDSRYADSIREELSECTVALEARGSASVPKQVASGVIELKINIDEATVRVDGLEMGRSPMPALTLKAGVHRIEVELEGHYPALKTVDLAGGDRLQVDIELQAKPEPVKAAPRVQPAALDLYVVPSGARVMLDGKLVGLSPVKTLALKPGTHRLRIVKPGFLAEDRSVEAAEGEPISLKIELMRLADAGSLAHLSQPPPDDPPEVPIEPKPNGDGPPRWSAWAAMGTGTVMLVGGAVLGSMALSKASAYEDGGPTSDRRALKDDGESLALTADVLMVAGVAMGATGVALYLFGAPDEPAEEAPRGDSAPLSVQLRPVPGGLVLGGRF